LRLCIHLVCARAGHTSGRQHQQEPARPFRRDKASGDQSNSPEDVKITATIRRAIVKDHSLSATAKNVKIITADGVVTLRGPVQNEAEKTKIAELAQSAAGNAKIDNQLEVKASK